MKLTLVAEDKVVVKDGEAQHNLKFQWLPSNVWALQWNDDNTGHIEYRDGTIESISELGIYQQAVDEWNTANNASLAPPDWERVFRGERDRLLEESDWTQLTDNALTDAKRQEWAVYRQQLRDLPANTSDFENVTYPTPPN